MKLARWLAKVSPDVPLVRSLRIRTDVAMRAGYAAYRRGDHASAVREFERAAQRRPDDATTWLALARAQRNLGDFTASHAAATRALEHRPGWPPAIWHLADLAARRQDAAELESTLRHLAEVDHWQPEDLQRATRLGVRAGAYGLVLHATSIILHAEPCSEFALFARAVALHGTGEAEQAAALLSDGQHRCGDVSVRAALRYAVHTGDVERLGELQEQAPDDVELLLDMARIQRRQGRLKVARDNLARARALRPADQRIERLRALVDGEWAVLSGFWSPPALPRIELEAAARRILHVVGRSEPHVHSGYTMRTQYTTRAQRDRGLDAQVVTRLDFPWNEGMDAGPHEDVDGVPHHRLWSDMPDTVDLQERLERNIEALLALVQQVRPSVLHAASDFTNAFIASAVARACSIPLVYEQRGFWEETWRSKQGDRAVLESDRYLGRQAAELKALLAADTVVTLADVMADELVRRGVDRSRIRVIPNAVDPDRFVPVERDPRLAQRFGIGSDEVTVGYVTSLLAYEGIRYLVEATARLRDDGLPVRAVIVGDGEDRPAIERRIDELGMRDHVVMTGRVPHEDVLDYYGLIDLFVVPRTNDRVCQLVTPLKPFEAMATGRPVIVSDLPALREIVDPGRTGFSFEPEDPDDLARVLYPLVLDPGLRAKVGQEARDWVVTNRTWSANAARYEALYAELGVVAAHSGP